MSTPLENYALLSDMRTAALVSDKGCIDWLCFPRFDDAAVFAALLGDASHGCWNLAPVDGEIVSRSYRDGSFVLDTEWKTPNGRLLITEYMPTRGEMDDESDLIREVTCLEGEADVYMDFRIRFNYGESIPWVEQVEVDDKPALYAVAGPGAVFLTGPLPEADGESHTGTFHLDEGETHRWDLIWTLSYGPMPKRDNFEELLADTLDYWCDWSEHIEAEGPYADQITRSLLVLRALTDHASGGVVAAPTTSLPEEFGGMRNWDYRYTWLRDSALTIEALIAHGFTAGAMEWRQWLLRALAGDIHSLRIMYGLGGERYLPEYELGHLPGYENSAPVRVGNGAADQFQGDVVGEVMVALDKMREAGIEDDDRSWGLQTALLEYAAANIDRFEHGIWEMRGDLAEFTHSRAMMWAAFDRGIRAAEKYGYKGPVDEWRAYRERLATEIEEKGWDEGIQSYTQTYGSTEVDASLLQLPHVGYIDYDHPRMLSTVARIEKDLVDSEGFVKRYRAHSGKDGLEGDEYPFILCTFWLVEQYAMSGRGDDALELMEKVTGAASPLGLYSEEYSTKHKRLAGNYPQAFSHLGLIRAADAVAGRDPSSDQK